MRWPVFAVFALGFIVVQLSLRGAFTLQSVGWISPDIVACLVVFVALFAHRQSALWACWILGVAMDLAPSPGGGTHIVGPYALGYVFGAVVILQLRTMVFRRRTLTMGFLTALCVLASSVVAVTILMVRSWYPGGPILPGGPFMEFIRHVGIAIYSGLLAIPLGWLLGTTVNLWGFQSNIPRRTATR